MARRKTSKKPSSKTRKNRLLIPYPALFFVLLCVGVLLALWTFRAVADDIVVTAAVPANLVNGPAVITNPTSGEHFSSIPRTISGTCPSDGSGAYVKIYRNNVFSGVALCDGGNNFSLSSDLFPGANVIKAQIYNITDVPGPASTPITAYYDAPAPQLPANASPSNQSSPVAAPPFIISSDFHYIGYYVGQTTEWGLAITGGSLPYAINVDWGDGTSSVVSRASAGTFSIEHKYASPGKQKNHSYAITISGSDLAGDQSRLQLFVIINYRNVGPVAAAILGATCNTSGLSLSSLSCYIQTRNLLKFLWPAYAIVLLMVASYWLGEREEVTVLTRKGLLAKRRT